MYMKHGHRQKVVSIKKLVIFKKKFLRNVFGPIYNTVLGTFERRKYNNLYRLYEIPNT